MKNTENTYEIKYDAFISYRHTDFDSAIAERLHKKLERYHIPKVIQQLTGRKRIERVFRDKEELPLTSNLTKDIYEALDHADYLIVICSLASKASLWVQKEVSHYVEKHGRDHVITVLIDGEPGTAFPEILCRDECDNATSDDALSIREPLAADVRAVTVKQSIKQLNKEFLRLVAALIGCPYDSLKRRHQAYRMKCISAVSFIAISIFMGVLSFTIYENKKVFRYRQESFGKEAEYLADRSMESLRSGNRTDALRFALQMSSLDDLDTFQSPLQAYALNNALYTYRNPFWKEYVPISQSSFDNIEKGFFSKNGQFYCAITEWKNGTNVKNVYVYSGENGEYLYTIKSSLINEKIEELKAPFEALGETLWDLSGEEFDQAYEEYQRFSGCDGKIQYVIPGKDTEVLLILNDAACLYDLSSKEVIDCFLMPSGSVSQGRYGDIYMLPSGELYYFIQNGKEKFFSYDLSEQKELSFEEFSKVGLVDISENGKEDMEIIARTGIDDHRHAVLIREKPEEQKSVIDGRDFYTYYAAIYDKKGNLLWTGEKITTVAIASLGDSVGIRNFNFSTSDWSNEYIVSWVDKTLLFMNADSGNTIAEITFDSTIQSVDLVDDNSVMVGVKKGLVQEVSIDDVILQSDRLHLSGDFSCVEYHAEVDTIAAISNGIVYFCKITGDSEMNLLEIEKEWNLKIDEIQYSESSKMTYRIIQLEKEKKAEFLVYPVLSDASVYHYIADDELSKIADVKVVSKNGSEILIVVEYNTDSYMINHVHEIDLDSGIELENYDVEYAEIAYNKDFALVQDDTMIAAISQEDKYVLVPLNTDKSAFKTMSILPEELSIEEWSISTIENAVVFVCYDFNVDYDTKELYVYHPGSDQADKVDFTFSTRNSIRIEKSIFSDLMAISYADKIIVLDTNKGSIIREITLPKTFDWGANVGFFNNDRYLLAADEKEVFLYEISSGNLLNLWTADIVDEKTGELYDYELIVGKNDTFFALKDPAFIADYDGRWGKRPLIICFVDEKCNIIPYANVNYGSVDLNSGEIATNTDIYFQYAPLYDVESLRLRAEDVMADIN